MAAFQIARPVNAVLEWHDWSFTETRHFPWVDAVMARDYGAAPRGASTPRPLRVRLRSEALWRRPARRRRTASGRIAPAVSPLPPGLGPLGALR